MIRGEFNLKIGLFWQVSYGGIRTFQKNLINHLLKNGKNNYLLINIGENLTKNIPKERYSVIQFDIPKDLRYLANNSALRTIFNREYQLLTGDLKKIKSKIGEEIILPQKLRGEHLDIFHGLGHYVPVYWPDNYKKIMTVYDISPILFPEVYPKNTARYYKYIFSKRLEVADKIIAISKNTKKDLIKQFQVSENKIEIVYPGIEPKYKPIFKTKDKYILSVGTLQPRKNYAVLIRAFSLLKGDIEHNLVIVGKKGWKYKEIFKEVKKLGLENRVVFKGYLSDDKILRVYNDADLFVFPSLYEGFGLPPLEAMACGTPVLASNTSSLPEVIGDAGLMIDPHSAENLANAMYEMLTNNSLRQVLIKRGFKNVKRFTWEKTAEKTLEVYKKVHDEK